MNTYWTIQTHGDPLGTVRDFMRAVWSQSRLDGMLLPLNGDELGLTQPRLVTEPTRLDQVNPFKPLMTENASCRVPSMVRDHPKSRFGVLLRPCEMRALIEMTKHASFTLDAILTISVDCLGTFPADEYQWRAARKEASGGIAKETLQFARQGGIAAYRYRAACQVCTSPEASHADLNINVFGLPIRQQILVQTHDEQTTERIKLDSIANKRADKKLVNQHRRTLARLAERNQHTFERVTQGLGELLPQNVDALVDQFESCGDCRLCMDVCPICSVEFPKRGSDNRYLEKDVIRWLVSCAGCGMCEQACASHLPLSTIFGHIRQKLTEELGYTPGRSIDDPLPL